jgi:hypothetical protein
MAVFRHVAFALLVIGCSSSREGEEQRFICYQRGPSGGAWRECAPSLAHCAQVGCFVRPDAYCFQYRLAALTDGQKDATGLLCTPTERECEEWNADRRNVIDRSLGPCIRARPDEYPK